jgi:Spy/CpxP family protein refolding chaperone
MNRKRFAKRVGVAAAFLFLFAAPGLIRAQSSPSTPVQTPHRTSPVTRPKKVAPPADDFAGLQYTEEQKARIDQIHKDMKLRVDAVVKDEKLSAEQKGAMLDGYRRMERNQIFQVLTPEQQAEVRKKLLARRAAARAEKNKQEQSPLPK